ncbi:hypothetical protein PMAYCL1PPCAC_21952, partial [Pristionchus mayeri]
NGRSMSERHPNQRDEESILHSFHGLFSIPIGLFAPSSRFFSNNALDAHTVHAIDPHCGAGRSLLLHLQYQRAEIS